MFQEQWFELDSGNRKLSVAVRDGQGNQPSLVLLHGVTRFWRDWEPMIPFLSHRWKIFGVDHRGHGQSDRADRYLVSDYANDLTDLIEQKAFGDSVVLAGHSLGAMAAAIAASRSARYVRAVVLEDPPLDTMGSAIHGTTWQTLFEGMQRVAKQAGSIDQMSQALGAIEFHQPDGNTTYLRDLRNEEALRWGASCLSKLDAKVLDPVIAGRWLEGIDWQQVAQGIDCQTVLLQADVRAGGALGDQLAESFSKSCKGCQRLQFPGKNHQLHGSIPAEIAGVVNRFIDAS